MMSTQHGHGRSIPSYGAVVLVCDLMTAPPITIEADATLGEARDLLEREGIHHVLVRSGGRIVGMASDRDVLRNLSPFLGTLAEQPRDQSTLQRRLFNNITSYQVVTIPECASVHEAAALLLDRGISSLVAVDEAGEAVGIITTSDLLRGLLTCPLPALAGALAQPGERET